MEFQWVTDESLMIVEDDIEEYTPGNFFNRTSERNKGHYIIKIKNPAYCFSLLQEFMQSPINRV